MMLGMPSSWGLTKALLLWGHVTAIMADDTCSMGCCVYCRSEPKYWMTLAGSFSLAGDSDAITMQNPAAFMVDETAEARFSLDDDDYKLHYAGAPLRLRHSDLTNPDAVLNEQFIQVDLATQHHVGGLLTQGGFYEEKLQDLYALRETWLTEFVVSSSNGTSEFDFHRGSSGNILYYQANSDVSNSKLVTFPQGITARYLRIHPLRAEGPDGSVDTVNIRLTSLTCSEEACDIPRINCLMTEWSEWSSCKCDVSCTKSRTRDIRRVQACGGSTCPDVLDIKACEKPDPLWKSILQYVGAALGLILLIALVAFCIYRKKTRNQIEIITVKDVDHEPIVEPSEKARPLPKLPHGLTGFHPPPAAAPAPPGMAMPHGGPSSLPRQPPGVRQRPVQGPGTPTV